MRHRVLEKHRKSWEAQCRNIGVRPDAIGEVIQNAYITIWKYTDPSKITNGTSVSHGYMYFALRSSWMQLFNSDRNKDKKVLTENMDVYCDPNFEQYVKNNGKVSIYEEQLKEFSDSILEQLTEFSTHHARFYKIYTSAQKPSYRELERDTGISYMTFYNDMNIIKAKILTQENQNKWDSINHELRL